MQEKLKQLELLVSQVLARQKETEGENAALKQKLRSLEEAVFKLKPLETETKELREFKKNTANLLRRLETKIDKELQKAKEEQDEIV